MLFRDFLKATVMASAGAATLLATLTVVGAASNDNLLLVLISVGWWILAGLYGTYLGRHKRPNPQISNLLANAQEATTLPTQPPWRIMLNRLWPILLIVITAGGSAFFIPQIAGIATGFTAIWSLAWRHQDSVVTATEDRDGIQFYIKPTSPIRPIKLIRTPGLKRDRPLN